GVFEQVRQRERWLTRTTPLPWAGLLVSEQTRQFYAYKDISERFLAHVFGTFRCALEEHLPLTLLNDCDLQPAALAPYAVLVLARRSSGGHPFVRERRLQQPVPTQAGTFRGPLGRVSEPKPADAAAVRMSPEGSSSAPLPPVVLRSFGKGRVAYFAAAVEAA